MYIYTHISIYLCTYTHAYIHIYLSIYLSIYIPATPRPSSSIAINRTGPGSAGAASGTRLSPVIQLVAYSAAPRRRRAPRPACDREDASSKRDANYSIAFQ